MNDRPNVSAVDHAKSPILELIAVEFVLDL